MAAHTTLMPATAESNFLSTTWNCDTRFITTSQVECTWMKPVTGEVAINTDGSLSDNAAGFGAIIRDEVGTPLDVVTGSSEPLTITHHELHGVEAGLNLAVLKNHTRVSLRSDSMTAVSYLLRPNPKPPWKCHHIWESIKRLRAMFLQCSVHHTYRETNKAADFLASSHPTGDFIVIDPNNFSEELKKIVYEDAIVKVYIRE
ncbi:uncharacterized protein LOC113350658 [Papaver somniferum]|uniref:uncharacterized protein LOC113350658 n=1 Tax=Papaver somniferum TaxID=3469 RepID=UPI000E6FB85F|nr:uncharacterized protein LOC113350658 [Papaver somniferum]